jgi:hypothetical protein
MEPERQRHIGIPASTSNRVAAIADFNQEVARAAGAFRDRPLPGSLIENLGERAFRPATGS